MLDRPRAATRRSTRRGHPASLVAVSIAVLIALGGLLRPLVDDPADGVIADTASRPTAKTATGQSRFPAAVTLAPGLGFDDQLAVLDRAAVDTDELRRLVEDPEWAGLGGTGWETERLDLLLIPGDYTVTSPDPRPLVTEMLDRLRLAVDDELVEAAADRGLSPAALVERAALVAARTDIVAEMPVVAELIAGDDPAAPRVAPTIESIRAVIYPTALGNQGSRDLAERVGPASTLLSGARSPAGEDTPPDDLQRLLVASGDERQGSRTALATGPPPAFGSGVRADAVMGPDAFFETGELDELAAVLATRLLLADGSLRPTDPLVVPDELLDRELPLPRAVLRDGDIALALDLTIDGLTRIGDDALIATVGAPRMEAALASVGVDSTSLRSQPRVTTAADVLRIAQLLDAGDPESPSILDRFLARETPSAMASSFVRDRGFAGFAVAGPRWFHEIARLADGDDAQLLVHLGDGGQGARAAAARTAHEIMLYARNYRPSFGEDAAGCRFSASAAGPLSGRTVGLDPGHGGRDPGAVRALTGGRELHESAVNAAIARALTERLTDAGADVVLTRCDDETVSLGARAHIFNRAAVDIALSIHADAAAVPTINRSTVLRSTGRSAELADAVAGLDTGGGLDAAVAATNGIRRVRVEDHRRLAVLMLTVPPAVLVEAVTLSHPAEAVELAEALEGGSDRIDVIADGLADGIAAALAGCGSMEGCSTSTSAVGG